MGKKLKRKTAAAAVAEVAALDAPKLKQKVKRRKRKAKEPGPMGPSAPANLESPQSWLARANADRVELRQEGVDWGLFATSQLPPNEVLLQIPEKKGAVEGTFGVAQWPEVFQPLVKRLGLTASAHPSSECGAEESLLVRPKKANVRLDGPTLHTSRDLKAGEQLSLGPTRENALLLLQHGFATSDNPHDLVRLALAESRQVTLSRRGIPQDVADAIEQEQDTQQFVSLLKGILEKRRALTDCQKQLPKELNFSVCKGPARRRKQFLEDFLESQLAILETCLEQMRVAEEEEAAEDAQGEEVQEEEEEEEEQVFRSRKRRKRR
ncbi:unnamed protein product [Effrenium voratum]|nr:unnamed protein product [Effrenium voratum]